MAALASASSSVLASCPVSKPVSASSLTSRPVIGLPTLRKVQITCSANSEQASSNVSRQVTASGVVAATLAAAQPALALVDDRLSTEGTGLSLGVSNPLLIWILGGVFGLIWALFFLYASTLPGGDDDSGLAL